MAYMPPPSTSVTRKPVATDRHSRDPHPAHAHARSASTSTSISISTSTGTYPAYSAKYHHHRHPSSSTLTSTLTSNSVAKLHGVARHASSSSVSLVYPPSYAPSRSSSIGKHSYHRSLSQPAKAYEPDVHLPALFLSPGHPTPTPAPTPPCVQPGYAPARKPSARQPCRTWYYIIAAIVTTALAAVGLGVGLGLGLSTKNHPATPQSTPTPSAPPQPAPPQTLPPPKSPGLSMVPNLIDDSAAGMAESGMYFTSYTTSSASVLAYTSAQSQSGASSSSSSSSNNNTVNLAARGTALDLSFSSPLGTPNITLLPVRGSEVQGFGASLTDATAELFSRLNSSDPGLYNQTLYALFNRRSGMRILRVPIGATDFSRSQYTWADRGKLDGGSSTTAFLRLRLPRIVTHSVLPLLRDALQINPELKIMLLPWSPPAWLKQWGTLQGGPLLPSGPVTDYVAEYLAQCVRTVATELGVEPWALSVQNEPSNPTAYPSALVSTTQQLTLLQSLRGRLAELGLGKTRLVGLEDDTVYYNTALSLLQQNASAVDMLSWHCYNGSIATVDHFLNRTRWPGKDLLMTECSGLAPSASKASGPSHWAHSAKWWMDKLLIPSLQRNFTSVLAWNLALDQKGKPRLPTAYCDNCMGAVTVLPSTGVDGGVRTSPQLTLLSHFALASANLTRFGAGAGAAANVPLALQLQDKKCLSGAGFAAPAPHQRTRYGLVVHNTCHANTTTVRIGVQERGKSQDVSLPQGVSTLVWTM